MEREQFEAFAAAVAGGDTDVDLFGAAMLIACLGGPVDAHDCARQLDLIAEAVRDASGGTADPGILAQAIDHELFTVRAFHGNEEDYSEAANSYLDQVLERRTGLPITLSLLYMEVAQRVGLRCDGIGFPGHFIVRCGEPGAPIYVDPFHQGVRLDQAELLARLRSHQLGGATPESFLAAITRRQLLQRMLRNLHFGFRERRDLGRWRDVVELSLRLEPWNAALTGERGMLNYRLGAFAEALEDLDRYISASSPEMVSAGARRLLEQLRTTHGNEKG